MQSRFSPRIWAALTLALLSGCQQAQNPQAMQQPVVEEAAPESTLPHSDHIQNMSGPYARVYGEQQGAVATVNPIATQAAITAFEQGGNAFDAAIAAAFMLGVVDSHNSGIGGGCFILARLANGEVLAIDGREAAPAGASADLFMVDGQVQPEWSKHGALAVGIPGSVAAYYELQQRAGRLSFADVLLPAADIAEQGFAIDQTLALRLARTSEVMVRYPQTAAIFMKDGQPLSAGDNLVQKDLAKSYRALAKLGPAWFYNGPFAARTEFWMRNNGGIVTLEDFEQYEVRYRDPVVSTYKGYTLYGFPPPSSGGVHVAEILNILSQFPLRSLSEADYYHVLAEAQRLAFADRAQWLGDADFTPVPKGLISQSYGAQLSKKISLKKAASEVSYGVPAGATDDLFNKHTTHITAADNQGNWVAITTTLNTSFGSKVVVPGTGVLLNNQMDDFSASPGMPNAFGLVGSHANAVAAHKRPLSSMSPTLVVKDGTPVLALGAAGGPTIISQVTQVLLQALTFEKPLHEAMQYPRIHHQWQPNILFVEPTVASATQKALASRGHILKTLGSFGGTQAVGWDGKTFTAVTEPRIIARNANVNP